LETQFSHKVNEQSETIKALTWSPDNQYIASGSHKMLAVWDARTGKQQYSFSSLVSPPLIWSNDGKYIFSSGSDRIIVTNAITGAVIYTIPHGIKDLFGMAVSYDGKHIVVSGKIEEHLSRVIDITSGQVLSTHSNRKRGGRSVAYLPNTRYVVSDGTAFGT